MAPPGEEQHTCQRCGQPLRYIDQYGAWYCYVCQTYETPEVAQANVCPTCHQPLTYLEPYSAWYCYTCESYAMPEATTGAYQEVGYQYSTNCPTCGRDMSSGQCYYCLADEMIATAESSIDAARKIGASIGKVEEKMHQARRLVNEDKPQMAVEIAEEVEDETKTIREKHKRARKMMNALEDDLDKLAQFDVNTSTADNQLQLSRNFIRSGNYDKAIEFLTKAQEFADNAAVRAGISTKKKMVRRPRYNKDYPACPECANVVSKDKENCPYCDAPLFEEVPADQITEPVATQKGAVATSSDFGMLISEKDVGKVAPVEGVEVKSGAPAAGPSKPAPPPPAAEEGKCPKCGEEVEAEWAKCPFCSAPLTVAEPPPPPKPVVKPVPPPKPVEKPAPPPPAGLKCGECGSDIEEGWKRCPVCMSAVTAAPPKPAPPPPKPVEKPAPPPKPEKISQPPKPPTTMPQKPPTLPTKDEAKPLPPPPPPPPPPAATGSPKEKVEAELAELQGQISGLEAKGVNTAHAKNLVRLAQSFMKAGSIDKAQRYIRKARQAADELKAS